MTPGTGDLTRSTVSGLQWTYGATVFSTVVQFGYTAAMGRLLSPEDFGLVAMATVFLRFGTHFAEMGTGAAVVQRPVLSREAIRTAFTSSVLLGGVFAAAVALAAPLASAVFDNSQVVPIVRALALTLLLHGAGITAHGLLRRTMRFRALALVEGGSYALGYMAVGVTSALLGAGVWSLVAAAIGQVLLLVVFAYALAPHPIVPRLHRGELADLYGFGGRVSVIGFFEFLAENLDTFFIGAAVGAAPLGLYNRALLLVNLPLYRISNSLSTVLFPAFSRAADQHERLRRGYLLTTELSAAVLLPIGIGIAVAAPEIVAVLLGPAWEQAAGLVPVVAIASLAYTLALFAAIAAEATAALNRKLGLVVAHVALLAGLLAFAAGLGLRSAAIAVAVAALVRLGLYLALMRRVLGVTMASQLARFVPALAASTAVGLAIGAVSVALRSLGAGAAVTLTAQVATGAVTVLTVAWFGPLAPLRRELHALLSGAGLLGGRRTALIERALTIGR